LGPGEWHRVISDPRKNMMLDLKNSSKEEEAKVLNLKCDTFEIEVEKIPKKASILSLRELQPYSEAEEQFLIQ